MADVTSFRVWVWSIASLVVALTLVSIAGARTHQGPDGALAYIAWNGKSACLDTIGLNARSTRQLACGKLGQFTGELHPSLTWSHDGSELAYQDVSKRPGIYVIGSDGQDRARVVPLAGHEREFYYAPDLLPGTWSPDDTRLALDRWQSREASACLQRRPLQLRLAIADVQQHKLIEIPALPRPRLLKKLGQIEWVRGGEGLIYVVERNFIEHVGGTVYCTENGASLYTINADGSGRRLLLTARSITYAAMAADGTSVAYAGCASKATTTCGLHVAEGDGTNDRLLLRGLGNTGSPGLHLAWTSSGQDILVEDRGLYVVNRVTGSRRRVPIPSLVERGSDCGAGYGSFAVSRDETWAGGLSREDYNFDDCKDPFFVGLSVVPLAGPPEPLTSVELEIKRGLLDSISLFLR